MITPHCCSWIKIWTELKSVVHGQLEGIPVQYVERGGIHQDKTS